MSDDILSRLDSYFSSPLKDGEKRKILYLYDKEETYFEPIKQWTEQTETCTVLKVTPSNFFYTNYLIEKKQTTKHLFLYFIMDRPPIEENPLLDVLLYSEELKIDEKSQLFLALGIDPDDSELTEVVTHYQTFFRAKSRTNQFKKLFNQHPIQTKEVAEYSIFATLTKAPSANWMAVLIELFEEAALGKEEKWDQIVKFGDEKRFWSMMDHLLGYSPASSQSGAVSINDLMHHVFITYLSTEVEEDISKEIKRYVLPQMNPIIVFINQWMNTKDKEEAYSIVSTVVENEWDLDRLFHDLPTSELANISTFKWFDRQLIKQLIQSIQVHVNDMDRLIPLISKRRNTFWYDEFKEIYHFLKWAIRLDHYISTFEDEFKTMSGVEEIWSYYSDFIYRIDQAYRKMYVYYDMLMNESKEQVNEVKDQMERLYVNRFLPSFSTKWDNRYTNQMTFKQDKLQHNFFKQEVSPYAQNDRRIFVIISDGLRYEAGKELFLELTKEKKFNGEIDWMQTELPSITSIGMASLLPHQAMQLLENGNVLVDDQPTSGLANREAVLQKNGHLESLALKASDITQLNKSELREKIAGKKVVYIYHNKVDAIGDHLPTEHDVFQATKDSITTLKQLMHRLTNEVSAGSFLVTADHGYLYTRSQIPNSSKVQLSEHFDAWIKNKRFILSEQKEDHYSGLSFTLSERLDNNGYIAVPRGLNRFALQGGGYQYVHGGHLPQEMMVPLLRIKTDRSRNETPEVEVSLVSQSRTITNSVVWLNFLQLEPLSEKKKEKRLKLYFEDEDGIKISNEITLIADSENESSKDRVFAEKFVLLSEQYDPHHPYYFVMENSHDSTDIVKERFKLDLV